MRVVPKQLSQALYYLAATSPSSILFSSSSSPPSLLIERNLTTCPRWQPLIQSPDRAPPGLLSSPWSASQLRGAKFRGSDVKPGNVIERKGRIYQVIKSQHSVQGRGGAGIQVELRDVETGNKVNVKLRTDEAIEKVYVQDKPYTYLYMEDDFVTVSDPDTYDQLDVPKDMFGEAAVYLKDEMKVTVQLYDGKPMSASIPKQVTCEVVEAQVPVKGATITPQYKRVRLDNGLTVQVPAHVLTGDRIIIDTTNHSYLSRA